MSRRGWDDRRGPDNERKRRSEDDHYREDRKDSRNVKRHRSSNFEHDQGDRYRESNSRHANKPPGDDRPRRDQREKKSRFEQAFVKKEDSPEWGKASVKEEKVKPEEKEKPNFQTSGKLTEDRNMVNGVVIKYSEPSDSRKPKRRWRLYPFKGEKALPVLYIHRQSAYLMGRDRKIADIPLDHPSCSKQHAALQYRLGSFKRANGSEGKHIRPYLIDLESANGTFVNDVKLEPRRYHELMERDVLKFGFSSREYVVLHEQSKDEDEDDDVAEPQ